MKIDTNMMNRWRSCLVWGFPRFAATGGVGGANPPEQLSGRISGQISGRRLGQSPVSRIGGIVALTALTWAAMAPHATAQSMAMDIEGKYEVLQPPQQTETGDRIEVVDVFWYGCPHCYVFLPVMEAYEQVKPEYVEIRRLPAVFRENWVAHARAFYTAMLLGEVERTHRPLFEEIHEQRNPTDHREALAAFFERQGVDRIAFEQTWDSFAVESLVRKSVLMQRRYGITGTPSVVVNGKYRVTGRLAGSYDDMIRVVAALVEREREAQQGGAN